MNMHPATAFGSEGHFAPPIKVAVAPDLMPVRLHRVRGKKAVTPKGAVYVGRPTLWGNPFERREKIGHKRSVILYDAWLRGIASPYVLSRAGFSEAEIKALRRWRDQLIASLHRLRGRNLQCWCPLTSAWCHANILLRLANA
jgi:hypothetical protein